MLENLALTAVARQDESTGEIVFQFKVPRPHASAKDAESPLIAWELTGLERETLRQLHASNRLPAVTLGRRRYVRRDALLALFDSMAEDLKPKAPKSARAAAPKPADVSAALVSNIHARGAK